MKQPSAGSMDRAVNARMLAVSCACSVWKFATPRGNVKRPWQVQRERRSVVTWVSVRSCSPPQWLTDGCCQFAVTLRNGAHVPAAEVIQLYLHDPVAEVARPVQQLIATAKVDLPPGSSRTVQFTVPADLTCYTGPAGHRQVDPGQVELRVGRSSTDVETTLRYTLTGQRREVGFGRALHPDITLLPAD